jgi:Holliday junction resolvase RusA-like endonuclease
VIALDLPEPPSANRYWRIARGRPYLSSEAKAYKLEARAIALRSGVRGLPYPTEALAVTLTWFRGRRAGDLDNRAKVAIDALNGLLWADDRQIVELHLYRQDRPKEGGLHLIVRPV